MAYLIMFAVCFGEIFLRDLNANVPGGWRLEEGTSHVIDHDNLGAHLLVSPHGGGLANEEPQGFEGRSAREEAVHLPVVELFAGEPAAIDRVFIVPFC